VESVNKLMMYCNNPLNFITKKGVYDYKKQIQFYVAVNLLFEDLHSINISNSNYIKLRITFNFIDKLSNLICCCAVDHGYSDEKEVFKHILSKKFGEKLARMLRTQFGSTYEGLGLLMYTAVGRVYNEIHKKAPDIVINKESKEDIFLDIIRTMRNTAHGSFLNKNKFDTFMGITGIIPAEIVHLPLLLAFGIASDTNYFMGKCIK
jgi:hypothetical protein